MTLLNSIFNAFRSFLALAGIVAMIVVFMLGAAGPTLRFHKRDVSTLAAFQGMRPPSQDEVDHFAVAYAHDEAAKGDDDD